MFDLRYPADVKQDPEGKDWVVRFPDLKGTNTGGSTLDEALREAPDCLGSYLARLLAERKPVPGPSAVRRRQQLIPVPFWIAPKIALYQAMKEQGISNSELARRLKVGETVVRRMLDPDHATKAARIESRPSRGWKAAFRRCRRCRMSRKKRLVYLSI
jgi:antitoxin HicB